MNNSGNMPLLASHKLGNLQGAGHVRHVQIQAVQAFYENSGSVFVMLPESGT